MKNNIEIIVKWGPVSLSILFIFIYFIAPIIITSESFSGIVFSSDTGVIGDTIGGITGPLVAFLGILITFYAFYIQYEANIEQKKQFKKQDDDLKVERFENRFFELIKIHRENVSEISISGKTGDIESRKAIISMFNEFRVAYHTAYRIIKENGYEGITEKDIVNISFVLFYVGIGNNSNQLSIELLSKYDPKLIDRIIFSLDLYKKLPQFKREKDYKIEIDKIYDLPEINVRFRYTPFCGHMAQLGHYFRHVWTTIKYLEDQDENLITNKYEYLKIYRAQISSYEQLLLHYNSLTDLGSSWHKNNLLIKYKLTKNIPIPMAYLGPKLTSIYKDPAYFEWSEFINIDNY